MVISWPQNLPTSFMARHSKIYPKWDFFLENMPSGNPDQEFNLDLGNATVIGLQVNCQ
jgi:hypothetical protein